MTNQELVEQTLKENYGKYDIKLPWDKLPWSGDIIETVLNDGTIELVDRMVEFTLCSLYSFYFIDRYCLTMPPKGGPIPLKLFDFQKKALDDFQKYNKVIFRKCRQIGASIITGCYALWRANFQKGQNIKIISLTQNDALEFKEKTIDLNYEAMPGFLKSQVTRDGDSKTKLKLLNKSKIQVLAKSKNAGRGGTPSLVIIDEAAFNEWMDDIWKSILPSLDKGGDCIVISTTNGVGNWYHLTYTKAEAGINEFHAIYIPWWRYPGRDNPWLDDILTGKVENPEKFVLEKELEALSYIGNTTQAPWLWKMKANSKSDRDFDQEILAKFLGTGLTVIPGKKLEYLDSLVVQPKWVDKLPNDEIVEGLYVWDDVESGKTYTIAADVAKGSGKDFSAFHIYDVYGNKQVAEYKNTISTELYGRLIKKIALYYNNAFVIVETTGLGIAVFNEIYLTQDDAYQNVYVIRKGKVLQGWETTAKSRDLLIDDFYNDIMQDRTFMPSPRFVDEVKVFIWKENGRAEAMGGYNDDLILSHAIYSHLRDQAISSRPLGLSSSKVSAVDLNMEIEEMKWANLDDEYLTHFGMDFNDWCWMQDKPLPEGYILWKKNQKQPNKDNDFLNFDMIG